MVNADKYFINHDTNLNATLFTQTQNELPHYFEDELEPEHEYDSEDELDSQQTQPTQIPFSSNNNPSPPLFTSESEFVDRLLPDRKAKLAEEIERYRNLPKQVFTSCKYL